MMLLSRYVCSLTLLVSLLDRFTVGAFSVNNRPFTFIIKQTQPPTGTKIMAFASADSPFEPISDFEPIQSDSIVPLEMPWGEQQQWALRDNIHRYLVEIPQLAYENEKGQPESTYALWMALTRDVIELAGYDIEFIRKKYKETMAGFEHPSKIKLPSSPPKSLPLLDQFDFQPNGGVSGKIQGLKGFADGTSVQTSELVQVQLTIPRGYVLTKDGSSAYELGLPLSEETYSSDIARMKIKISEDEIKKGLVSSIEKTGQIMGDRETTDLLINLGSATAILLGSATAINMLSHHMTVNVFWV